MSLSSQPKRKTPCPSTASRCTSAHQKAPYLNRSSASSIKIWANRSATTSSRPPTIPISWRISCVATAAWRPTSSENTCSQHTHSSCVQSEESSGNNSVINKESDLFVTRGLDKWVVLLFGLVHSFCRVPHYLSFCFILDKKEIKHVGPECSFLKAWVLYSGLFTLVKRRTL